VQKRKIFGFEKQHHKIIACKYDERAAAGAAAREDRERFCAGA